jgi:two-component system, cell cycle sensor histidine kinase PleC
MWPDGAAPYDRVPGRNRPGQSNGIHVSKSPVTPGDAATEFRLASDATMDFLANVSHELRTPLTAILGFTEVIASGMDGPVTPSQAADLATIQASSRHLLELVDDLIDIAAIESGRIELLREPVDVGRIVREAAEDTRPLAGEKGISLVVNAPAAPIVASVDPSRLRTIALNLLSNAVKFTPSGGRVQVTVAPTSSAAGGGGRHAVEIRVRDSGIGIAPEDLERIFDRFVRVAGPSVAGTGLGLAIARELARLHGGDLTVESTVGIGSTFTVRLPLGEPS